MRRAFCSYLVADWSANGTPKTGKDSIWVALVQPDARPVVENPSTRKAAMALIEELIEIGRAHV